MKKSRNRQVQRNISGVISDYNLVVKTLHPPISPDFADHPATEDKVSSLVVVDNEDQVESDSDFSVASPLSDNTGESDESDGEAVTNFKAELRSWTITHNTTATATTDLLKLLHRHHCFKYLPLDCRTLLQTPRTTTIIDIPPGKYCSFDWITSIRKIILHNGQSSAKVKLQINIDGIPLYHSSSHQFWPILGAINENVFVIGIYSGQGKPNSVNEFLSPFLQQLQELPRPILINGVQYEVKLSALICDAPARAFVLGTKCHTGYSSCGSCTIKGFYYQNRVIFPYDRHPERTNITHREKSDPQHHNEYSFMEKTDLDLVKGSPGEYMHLVCLGIVRKILHLLTKGKKCPARLRPNQIEEISEKLVKLKKYIPHEFARKPRKLKDLDHWKATEFRQFILYTGPVVLKQTISKPLYQHFLSLHVAITILADKTLHVTHNNYANELLHYFVKYFDMLYGRENMSFNVHGLLHLANDCINHGQLDKFSAFKFENKLQDIKKLVRSTNCPLQQVHRRLLEREDQTHHHVNSTPLHPFLYSAWSYHNSHFDINCSVFYKKFQHQVFKLNAGGPGDSACEIGDGACVWLNYKNPGRIVKAVGLHMPPESNWSTHDVKLLGGGHKFVTYHEAVKKLPKVMDQSDAEVGSGDGKIRIRQEAPNTYESSESEGDDCHSTLPPPPAPNDNLMKNVKSLLITPAAKKVTTKGQSIPKIKPSKIRESSKIPFKLCLVTENGSSLPGVSETGNPEPDMDIPGCSASTEMVHFLGVMNENEPVTAPPVPEGDATNTSQSSCEDEISLSGNQFQSWVVRNVAILKAQNRNIQETLDAILLNLDGKRKPMMKKDDER
ncbi:hypothetical protein Fcan01_16170 [Folsomia candida]|uniref:DUF4806 domain-containing protein n=1 Tax=Folsomia candida TaxID=158441 RepID=A0A226DUI9_FOLCA|nr:hypothetical protein Fcan01_16170 [Folsomia candida]